jgi:nanoRNase/pAp phosphatase (c-di-AMP/oligoRNAs hydrolase)
MMVAVDKGVSAQFSEAEVLKLEGWGLNKLNTVLATGKSVLHKTSNTNIGELMLKYDGGGHENAGTCQIENEDTDRVFAELTAKITADG